MEQSFGKDFMPYAYNVGDGKLKFVRQRSEEICDRKFQDDAFMVLDIGDVLKKHQDWLRELPRVIPFFAVKCMPYTPLLSVLAAAGCGFDCASLGEIEQVLSLGVSPSRIVYSHCRKQMSYLSYAAKHNVDLMTFDDESEVLKIKEFYPEARLLLRLSIFDQTAQHAFGFKYGCHHKNVKAMLQFAQKHGLHVVGVHFHIGSGSQNPTMFETSIQFARKVFDTGNWLGFKMTVLDIGGGFPGSPRGITPFGLFVSSVCEQIAISFPADSGVTIIAEPGRYYVESAATLVTNIIGIKNGKKIRRSTGGMCNTIAKRHSVVSQQRPKLQRQASSIQRRLSRNESISHFAEMSGLPDVSKPMDYDYMYFVNDGLFTSFLRNLFAFPVLPPRALKTVDDDEYDYESMVMGETCPEEDVIVDSCMLPKMERGDWLVFEDMGAYTCMSTGFNGFHKRFFYYAVPESVWSSIQPLLAKCSEAVDEPDRTVYHSNNQEPNGETDDATLEIPEDIYSFDNY